MKLCTPCLKSRCVGMMLFLFFKQKTPYERRISDWSSDVCSSDLWGDLIKAALEGVPDNACAEVLYFCDYWLGLKGDGPLPPCEKLDPLDFFTYLSRVFILEGETIDDLKVRLAGTVYRELYGFEVTALRVGELIPFENRRDLLSG